MAPGNCGWELFVASFITLTLALIQLVEANSDVDALYALRQKFIDLDNVLQSWDPNSVNPCNWSHVTCNNDNRVTQLHLVHSYISGLLAPEIGNLEHLQYLKLYDNRIEGSIPRELGNLKNLIALELYDNIFTDEIPNSLGNLKSLVSLRLNNNRFTGSIPMQLTEIPSLQVVDLSSNDLCGTIPRNGSFAHIPLKSFANNPRLKGPGLLGLASYDTNCT